MPTPRPPQAAIGVRALRRVQGGNTGRRRRGREACVSLARGRPGCVPRGFPEATLCGSPGGSWGQVWELPWLGASGPQSRSLSLSTLTITSVPQNVLACKQRVVKYWHFFSKLLSFKKDRGEPSRQLHRRDLLGPRRRRAQGGPCRETTPPGRENKLRTVVTHLDAAH